MMGKIVHWVYEDDTDLGKPKLVGKQHTSTMAVPMMLLCLIEQLETVDDSLAKDYEHLTKTCIKEILTHIQVLFGNLVKSSIMSVANFNNIHKLLV